MLEICVISDLPNVFGHLLKWERNCSAWAHQLRQIACFYLAIHWTRIWISIANRGLFFLHKHTYKKLKEYKKEIDLKLPKTLGELVRSSVIPSGTKLNWFERVFDIYGTYGSSVLQVRISHEMQAAHKRQTTKRLGRRRRIHSSTRIRNLASRRKVWRTRSRK